MQAFVSDWRRTLSGFAVGMILAYITGWMISISQPFTVVQTVIAILAAPAVGFMVPLLPITDNEVLLKFALYAFYPLFCAAVFFLAGKKQTRYIILPEIILGGVFCLTAFVGVMFVFFLRFTDL